MSNKRYTSGKKLREMIGWDQAEYFPQEARRLMGDWIILDEVIDANSEELSFSDYSFAMAPMYKALEVVLWCIAKELKLVKKDEMLGAFFNEDNLDKISTKIETKTKKNKKKAKEVKGNLHEIKNFLIRYRHNPAHAGFYFKNLNEERLAASSALHNIKCLVQDLLELKLIKPTKVETNLSDADLPDIDPEDIPF